MKKPIKKILPILLLALHACGYTYGQIFHWARQAGANQDDVGNAIAADQFGNSYVTGSFKGTVTFGGFSLTSLGSSDIFVAKYNSVGVCLWAQSAKGLFNDWGNSISVDAAGNVYVTGIVGGGTIQFSSTQSISTGAGVDDIFIAKYSAAGTLQWVLDCGGTNLDYGSGIAAHSPTGSFYVTGVFEGAATFNTTSGLPVTLTSSGSGDIFVAYYNTNGVLLWVRRAGGVNPDYGFSITVDSQKNAYVTGTISSAFNWGGVSIPSPPGGSDAFVTKYNVAGNVLWVRTIVGPNADSGTGISVDSAGNPFVVGSYQDSLHFSNSALSLNSPGHNREIFIARYNPAGQAMWVRSAGSSTYDYPGGICVRDTSPYVTGLFTGNATFGNQSLTSVGSQDVFVARYDPGGALMWVRRAGGPLGDSGNGIGVDGAGHAYITGGYKSSSASFPGTGSLTNSNTITSNIFVAEIH